jgi:hypothetical protein
MAEQLEEGNEVVETTETVQATEPSPLEIEAREGGWVPKEEYSGDENKWVDAAEFVRRGPLFKKIETQSREIKAMRQAIADIQKLHANSREQEYKRALAEIRAEKKAALIEGDADAVIEADEKIEMLREAQREVPQQTEVSSGEQHPEFVNWVNRNQWYQSNKGMRAFADTVGADFRASGMSPADVLKAVEKEVRKEFPNRFVNPNQSKPGSVEGGVGAGTTKGGKDSFTLTDEERGIMRNLVRLNVLTEKEYIDEIKKTRGA